MKIFLKTALILVLYTASAFTANATEIRLEARKAEVGEREKFTLDVVSDGSEKINAIEGRLFYPADLLTLREIRDGDSVVNFWIVPPKSYFLDTESYILFSGMTPGGWSGPANNIFSAVFEAKKGSSGTALMRMDGIRALHGDGSASAVPISVRNSKIMINPNLGKISSVAEAADNKPPEEFTPLVGRDENLFGGKYFISFYAEDKGSGVAKYGVREGIWGGYRKAKSPYLLKNQNLNQKIFVRATDRVGNHRVVEVVPERASSEKHGNSIWAAVLFIILAVFAITKMLWGHETSFCEGVGEPRQRRGEFGMWHRPHSKSD